MTFSNVLLTSYQNSEEESLLQSYLKHDTVVQMWTPVKNTECVWVPKVGSYAMAWCVVPIPPVLNFVSNFHSSALKLVSRRIVGLQELTGLFFQSDKESNNNKRASEIDAIPKQFYISHTGGAIGASCVLLIKPTTPDDKPHWQSKMHKPRGICVAVLTNLQEASSLNKLALDIAAAFESSAPLVNN